MSEWYEPLIDQIKRDAIPELDLLDERRWIILSGVHDLHLDTIDPDEWLRVEQRRLKTFREQWDGPILRGIIELSIHDDFLYDPECWKRICQVWTRHRSEVPDGTWEDLCTRRGHTNVPRGPYR